MSQDSADESSVDAGGGVDSGAGGSVDGGRFDDRVVDILSWVLDTETRARIYVYLRQNPWSTSEEVADGTGLYPSTVREALATLAEDDTVSRRKRQNAGAGNNPYEYTATAPSELVREVVGDVQDELNTLCNLDENPGGCGEESDPVRIEVTAADEGKPKG